MSPYNHLKLHWNCIEIAITLWWTNITMGNHHFSWENPLFLWPCSIAMLVPQRVNHHTPVTSFHHQNHIACTAWRRCSQSASSWTWHTNQGNGVLFKYLAIHMNHIYIHMNHIYIWIIYIYTSIYIYIMDKVDLASWWLTGIVFFVNYLYIVVWYG